MKLYGLYNVTFVGITKAYSLPVVLISCLQSFMQTIGSRYVVIKNVIFRQYNVTQNTKYFVHETITCCLWIVGHVK